MINITEDINAIKIREAITKYKFLKINRIPNKTYDQFHELAKEEFCDDFGFVLKFLVDFYYGLIPSGVEHLEVEIDQLKEEVKRLLNKVEDKKEDDSKKPKKTMLDGTTIKNE